MSALSDHLWNCVEWNPDGREWEDGQRGSSCCKFEQLDALNRALVRGWTARSLVLHLNLLLADLIAEVLLKAAGEYYLPRRVLI